MSKFKSFWGSAGLLAASTIGAGMFSLPYVFKESGWLVVIFYLVVLSSAIIFAHYLYWLVLERVGEKKRLLGLVRAHLGGWAFYIALVSIIIGLLLTLVVYLLLAQNFGKEILPTPLDNYGAIIFWITASLPLLFNLTKLVKIEGLATILKSLIVFSIFLISKEVFPSIAPVKTENFFLPFGAVLFSLAGWTAIEPMFEWQKKSDDRKPLLKLALGTFFSAAIYVLFVIGVLAHGGVVSEDAFSSVSSWTLWELQLFVLLGILAIWTPYAPISLEIKNGLEKDLRLPAFWSFAAVLLIPPAVFLSGVFNFLGAISLAGGVFLALQYIFIILVAKKILGLSGVKKVFANILLVLFFAAAVYEILHFI